MALGAGVRVCGDGEGDRSEKERSDTADAVFSGEGEGHVLDDSVCSRSCDDIDCVWRAGSAVIGLLRLEDDDAALTAADAGVTVIATDVVTAGSGSLLVGVEGGSAGMCVPYCLWPDEGGTIDGMFISKTTVGYSRPCLVYTTSPTHIGPQTN